MPTARAQQRGEVSPSAALSRVGLAALLAGVVLLLLASPGFGKVHRGTYITKARTVAQAYWHARLPASDCSDRPVQIIVNRIGEVPVQVPVFDACTYPYDPANDAQAVIIFTQAAFRSGWLPFCTAMIQSWGHLAGAPTSNNSRDVMYPKVTSRNYQRKACGKTP